MNTPLISVALPIHNGERFLEESIYSILAQSYTNWELIVYDAASTDATRRILEDLWARYPLLQNQGTVISSSVKDNVPKSLNLAFKQARGQYFTWTSDDNHYLPEAFKKMLGALNDHPESALTYAHSYKIDLEGKRTGTLHSMPCENLVYGNNIGLCFLYRREVAEAIGGYDEAMFLVEDYDFWMRASAKFKFHHLNEVLYEIRYHPESLTSNNLSKMYLLSEDAFDRDFPAMQSWLPPEWKIRGHLRLAKTGVAQRKWKRVIDHSIQGLATSPALMLKESAAKLARAVCPR